MLATTEQAGGYVLLGRSREQQQLRSLVEAAKGGLSGALVLRGEVGMGKTALLDFAVQAGVDLPVLRIAGIESERDFGFAALHRLLKPLLPRLERIPEPQRQGLSAAFGLSGDSPADRFLIGLATLTLLADYATANGLLCIVDDSQWIDTESQQALGFVGRRLAADGIVLLFGWRTAPETPVDLAGIPVLDIPGLPDDAAQELLSSVVRGPLHSEVVSRVVSETGACPLALIELADELTTDQWQGTALLLEPIPMSRRMEIHFRRQVDALPSGEQTFLLVAAAETSGDVALVRRAAGMLGCEPDAGSLAIHHRLLFTEPIVQFRHPLIRSAVYTGAAPIDRTRVHRALANSIDRLADLDRWIQHTVPITRGFDDALASALEAAASRARNRGGYSSESALFERSAGFTQGGADRAMRVLKAAAAALSAGAPRRARKLLREVESDLGTAQLEAQAKQLHGRLRVTMIQPSRAPALFWASAQQSLPFDAIQARDSMLEAFDAYLQAQHFTIETNAADIAAGALQMRRPASDRELPDLLLRGTALLFQQGFLAGVDTLKVAAKVLRNGGASDEDTIRWSNYGLIIANELLDDKTYAAWVDRVEELARKKGALVTLQTSLAANAERQLRRGRFESAEAYYDESLEIASAIGGEGSVAIDLYKPLKVSLFAWRGNTSDTTSAADALIAMGEAVGMASVQYQAFHALAILELGRGRFAEVLQVAERCTDRMGIGWRTRMLPLVVEGGVRSGNRDIAEKALAELRERATSTATPWALGMLEYSTALVSDGLRANEMFMQSIAYLERTMVETDLAIAHLSYGEWLLDQDHDLDARTQLRSALHAFESMGADGFAARARSGLATLGDHPARPRRQAASLLTPQEARIAQLASIGKTNQEIAAQIFVSSSTVDYHLRKVFRKTGVNSRRRLKDVLEKLDEHAMDFGSDGQQHV